MAYRVENKLTFIHIKKSSDRADYRDYYDAETRRVVEQFYGDDIKKLGYSF